MPNGLTQRLSCNVYRGADEMADACLNDFEKLTLCEIKAAVLPESAIIGTNYESYLDCLRERYSKTEGTSEDRGTKGVAQLARTINVLASKEWLGKNDEFSNVTFIYPVMIVHDRFMTAFGHGNFFVSEFKACLEPDEEFSTGYFKKGHLRIAPPILMTIEDLENLEVSIENFAFCELLADYSCTYHDRVMPIDSFIANSEVYKNKIYANQNIIDKALELLDKFERAIPQSTGETA